ncbi:MAG: aminopeptidase [Arcicella sp.]|nr:aminopeptidase [Arcicella sp.]
MLLLQKQIQKSRRKRNWLIAIFLIISLLIWQKSWIVYFYQQFRGGYHVAFDTRPLQEVLQDKTVPDSLKKRILFIAEVKKFATDTLHLQDNPKVYQTLHDQKGKVLSYLLTVAEPYKMEAKQFSFPIVGWIIGDFTYKGFFDSTAAFQEQKYYQSAGYDTNMGTAAAYSTLGWLPEPILSSMLLHYSDYDLANTIIHEMTHGTIFVKNNHELSENLANFVGGYGAKRFLKSKLGADSEQFKDLIESFGNRKKRNEHRNRGTLQLDSLYRTFSTNMSKNYKDSLKYALIEKIIRKQDTLGASFSKFSTLKIAKNDLPNNAFFISFKTYNSKQNEFELQFKNEFGENFDSFLEYLKKKYN